MSEHVTTVRTGGPNQHARLAIRALARRFGDGDQIRSSSYHKCDAARQLLEALAPRLGIESVSYHLCLHDEDKPFCN